jgi:hypothetical protein
MKRIRRISIEVERRETTLYATSSSWSNPDGQTTASVEPAVAQPDTQTLSQELATSLKEGRVHLHRCAKGHVIVCSRKDCDD